MRLAVVLILIATANSVQAIQPVESGLQLLLDRQRIILSEQKLLSQSLQSSTTEPEERAAAYRTYMTIELEKRQLECEIERARRWATSPLVMHAVPAADVACQSAYPPPLASNRPAQNPRHPIIQNPPKHQVLSTKPPPAQANTAQPALKTRAISHPHSLVKSPHARPSPDC